MRVMLDTNVILSVLLFPSKRMNLMMMEISMRHTLILSSFVIEELYDVVRRKFPQKADVIDSLLSKMSYELVYTPQRIEIGIFSIRDEKDYPVLYTAIAEGVDVLVTGDKDFSIVEIESPEIITPADFVEKYCS